MRPAALRQPDLQTMSARIIPYMARHTADEFRRRRHALLAACWAWLLWPAYFAAVMTATDEEEQ